MFWHVVYNRPRGIAGNYKIVIAVNLCGGESINIERFGSSNEQVEHFHYDLPVATNRYRYTVLKDLRRVIPGDSFRITIEDPDVAYPQKNYYEVTPTGISGGLEEGSIELYPLHLVDLDLVVKNTPQWWNELFTGQFGVEEWDVISAIHNTLKVT